MNNIKLLLLIPFIGMCLCLPFANKIEPYVLGLPFLLFWIILWMIISSLVLAIVYKFDPENQGGEE